MIIVIMLIVTVLIYAIFSAHAKAHYLTKVLDMHLKFFEDMMNSLEELGDAHNAVADVVLNYLETYHRDYYDKVVKDEECKHVTDDKEPDNSVDN